MRARSSFHSPRKLDWLASDAIPVATSAPSLPDGPDLGGCDIGRANVDRRAVGPLSGVFLAAGSGDQLSVPACHDHHRREFNPHD